MLWRVSKRLQHALKVDTTEGKREFAAERARGARLPEAHLVRRGLRSILHPQFRSRKHGYEYGMRENLQTVKGNRRLCQMCKLKPASEDLSAEIMMTLSSSLGLATDPRLSYYTSMCDYAKRDEDEDLLPQAADVLLHHGLNPAAPNTKIGELIDDFLGGVDKVGVDDLAMGAQPQAFSAAPPGAASPDALLEYVKETLDTLKSRLKDGELKACAPCWAPLSSAPQRTTTSSSAGRRKRIALRLYLLSLVHLEVSAPLFKGPFRISGLGGLIVSPPRQTRMTMQPTSSQAKRNSSL